MSLLVKQLFAVLKHYGYLGSVCSDSNQELVAIAFKVSLYFSYGYIDAVYLYGFFVLVALWPFLSLSLGHDSSLAGFYILFCF